MGVLSIALDFRIVLLDGSDPSERAWERATLQSTEKQGSQIADEDANFNLGAGLRESRADDAQRSML